jgi:hypothetical protein
MRILRGLTSRLLPCGCMAGVYETYDGAVVTLLEDREAACSVPGHTEGNQIADLAGAPARAPQPRSSRR